MTRGGYRTSMTETHRLCYSPMVLWRCGALSSPLCLSAQRADEECGYEYTFYLHLYYSYSTLLYTIDHLRWSIEHSYRILGTDIDTDTVNTILLKLGSATSHIPCSSIV